MTYRQQHPFVFGEGLEPMIIEGDKDPDYEHIIKMDISVRRLNMLPDDFKFRTLDLKYIDEIHKLLLTNYVEDDDNIIMLTYTKQFLHWCLKKSPKNLIIGLTYRNNLIGLITATITKTIILGKMVNIPTINFLCVQKSLRNIGLAGYLIEEIRLRLVKMNIEKFMATSGSIINQAWCTITSCSIPINYDKLRKVEFLIGDFPPLPIIQTNPLGELKECDLSSVANQLNEFHKKYDFRPYFDADYVRDYMLPKKNIVYSYVLKNNDVITDFISVTKTYYYCFHFEDVISIANLTYYFTNTMSIRDLVCCLIDKIKDEFDQLNFYNMMDNDEIHLNKFETNGILKIYFYNVQMPFIENKKISMLII